MLSLCLGVFVASVLGSLHCVGMCGGFVAMYAGDAAQTQRVGWAHLSYSGGRLLAYLTLGVLVGSAGAMLNFAGRAAGLQRAATWLGGGLLLLWGAAMLLRQYSAWQWSKALPLGLQRLLMRLHRYVQGKPPVTKALLLGLMSGCLPCGWLYAFVLTAAATGSPWRGGMIMTSFWLGTLPAMLGLGWGMRWLGLKIGRYIPTISAVAVIVMGALSLLTRAHIDAAQLAQRAVQSGYQKSPVQQLRDLSKKGKKPHCCAAKPRTPAIRPRPALVRPQPAAIRRTPSTSRD